MGKTDQVKAGAEKARIARAAGLVSAMTLVSRLLGLVREVVFAALIGAGYHSDAFKIAFRIPNLLRDLFAEGALSAAFVPTYARAQREGGREAGFALANRVLTLLAVLLGGLVLAAIVFAWPLVSVLASGFDDEPGKAALTVFLTRIMMPFLLLVSFAAVAMGMLNAEERFGIPALSPALFNLVAIVCAAVLWARGLPRRAGRGRLGRRRAARGPRAAPRAGPVPAPARVALPPGVGPARPRPPPGRPPDGPGHGRPRRRRGQHRRQQLLRLPGGRGGLLARLRLPPAVPAGRPLRGGPRHDRHRRPRPSRRRGGHGRPAEHAPAVAVDARLPDRARDGRPHGARGSGGPPPLRARALHPGRHAGDRGRAPALLHRPRGLHRREGPGPGLLRPRAAARPPRSRASPRWRRTSSWSSCSTGPSAFARSRSARRSARW